MPSNWMKNELEGENMAEIARYISLPPATFRKRLERDYKPWTYFEMMGIAVYLADKGIEFNYSREYSRILRESERLEDLIVYVPKTHTQIAYMVDMEPSTFAKKLSEGFTDIEEIQKLKDIIRDYSLLKVRKSYY